MIGLGLLEAIPEDEILARADPDDADRDGISGRRELSRTTCSASEVLGRMGLKASQPSVLQQAARRVPRRHRRHELDLLATVRAPTRSAACLAREAERPAAGATSSSSTCSSRWSSSTARHLAVPERRGWDDAAGRLGEPRSAAGASSFYDDRLRRLPHAARTTPASPRGSLLGDVELSICSQPARRSPTLSNQTIWPYTDLLLHDMGGACEPTARETATGDACDDGPGLPLGAPLRRPRRRHRPTARRAAPSGGRRRSGASVCVQVVNPDAGYLHDGRARTIEEAILWHGGEAEAVQRRFIELESGDRQAMLAFLESQ